MARRFCRDAAHLIAPIEAFPARAASRASADPTKTVAPGEPLTGLTGTGAGAVPGEIGKDAQGPRLADQGDTFGHVPAMPLGDEPQRGLVLLDILQVDPEASWGKQTRRLLPAWS